jgi:hypothetical protein
MSARHDQYLVLVLQFSVISCELPEKGGPSAARSVVLPSDGLLPADARGTGSFMIVHNISPSVDVTAEDSLLPYGRTKEETS